MPTYLRPARVGQRHRIFLEQWYKFPANLTVYQNNMGYLQLMRVWMGFTD